ncbi:MAG: hypothetical protein DRJ64_07460, partial [Thermoprotei archaeon]
KIKEFGQGSHKIGVVKSGKHEDYYFWFEGWRKLGCNKLEGYCGRADFANKVDFFRDSTSWEDEVIIAYHNEVCSYRGYKSLSGRYKPWALTYVPDKIKKLSR